jgi:hypothetical protein
MIATTRPVRLECLPGPSAARPESSDVVGPNAAKWTPKPKAPSCDALRRAAALQVKARLSRTHTP